MQIFNPDVEVTRLHRGLPSRRRAYPITLCMKHCRSDPSDACPLLLRNFLLFLAAPPSSNVCQEGTKSFTNPFTGNGCHPSDPFKFDLAKSSSHVGNPFSRRSGEETRGRRRALMPGKLNESGGGIPRPAQQSLHKSNTSY